VIELFVSLPNNARGTTLHLPYYTTHNVRLTVTDRDTLAPVDLTGAQVYMTVRKDVGTDPTYTINFAGTQSAVDGVVTATWAMSASMMPGRYVYDLWGTIEGVLTQLSPLSVLLVQNTSATP